MKKMLLIAFLFYGSVAQSDTFYIGYVDSSGGKILKCDSSGNQSVFADLGFGIVPLGMALDRFGNLYVSALGYGILRFDQWGSSSVFVNDLSVPAGLAFDCSGNLYVAENLFGLIKRIDPNGNESVFAAGFSGPWRLAFDANGNLYVSNSLDGTISIVDPNGNVSTFVSWPLWPRGLAFDKNRRLWFTQRNAFIEGYPGDLIGPDDFIMDIALESNGTLLIADSTIYGGLFGAFYESDGPNGVGGYKWRAVIRGAIAPLCVAVPHTQPPQISAVTVTPSVLWPPNGKMVAVKVDYDIEAPFYLNPCLTSVLEIASNESPKSDEPDWEVVDAHHVLLRADSKGRVYTITVRSTDGFGNSGTNAANVTVPYTPPPATNPPPPFVIKSGRVGDPDKDGNVTFHLDFSDEVDFSVDTFRFWMLQNDVGPRFFDLYPSDGYIFVYSKYPYIRRPLVPIEVHGHELNFTILMSDIGADGPFDYQFTTSDGRTEWGCAGRSGGPIPEEKLLYTFP